MDSDKPDETPAPGKFKSFLYTVEDTILVGLLLLLIGLAVVQILLRNILGSGIIWGDILVRILVLWTGLAGAMAATRRGDHISIDILSRFLSIRAQKAVDCFVQLFAAGICSAVAWYSLRFVLMEYEDGGNVFASVPVWLCESIIPIAFTVIAFRYLVLSLENLAGFIKNGSS